jgi:hypothetical protein
MLSLFIRFFIRFLSGWEWLARVTATWCKLAERGPWSPSFSPLKDANGRMDTQHQYLYLLYHLLALSKHRDLPGEIPKAKNLSLDLSALSIQP